MNNLLTILLQSNPGAGTGTGGGGSTGGGLGMFLPLILIVVVFYFLMIRPQQKKTKDAKKFREALKKGDKIITIGGIHGKILEVQDTTFIIETEGLTRLKIEKAL